MVRLLATFVALLVLTTLTLALSYLHLAWETPIALAIAAAKAALIALFFMELIDQRTTNWVGFVVSILLACVFVGLSLLDVVSRGTVDARPRLAAVAPQQRASAPRAGDAAPPGRPARTAVSGR